VTSGSDGDRPGLIVVVDTEEEFDWNAPFSRGATSVSHMAEIGRLQAICDRHGVRPAYLVDYPIATDPLSLGALRPLIAAGRALVGAHLHPWVSPPHEEEVSSRNSYPGNLPPPLEREKLARLATAIERGFGVRPRMYKAGRYGIGPNSFAILEELGFAVDLSPSPPFDYSAEGGPDYTRRGLAPAWEGPGRSVLSIPGTGALVGSAASRRLYAALNAPPLRRLRAPAIGAKLGLVERIRLSPEGHSADDMARLVRALLARGERLFVLSLHSPSVVPGHTPYARTEAERDALLDALDGLLGRFMGEFGGRPTDPLAIHAEALRRRAGSRG
jgi:hypothetical protein